MEEQTLRDEIRKLIARNKTEDAFEVLSSIQFSKEDKQLIVLNSQYNRIKEELRLNIISKDEGERRINQINMALLDISNKIDSPKRSNFEYKNISPPKQSFNPKWLLLLLIPFAAFLIYWGMNGNNKPSIATNEPIHSSGNKNIEKPETNNSEEEPSKNSGTNENNETDSKKEPETSKQKATPIVPPKPTPAPVIDILKLNSLVAYYPLDGSGIDTKNSYNATNTIGVQSQKGRHGEANGSFYFDGKESRIELPKLLDSQSKNYSISVWIKTLNGSGQVWGQYTKSDTKYIGNNHSVFLFNKQISHDNYPPTGGTAKLREVPGNRIPIESWTHVVFTRNSSALKLYINGKLIGDRTETETFSTEWGDAVYSVIGFRPRKKGTQLKGNFNGSIDDLLIFDSAIEAKIVSDLYNLKYKY